jgi:hypothetical protein
MCKNGVREEEMMRYEDAKALVDRSRPLFTPTASVVLIARRVLPQGFQVERSWPSRSDLDPLDCCVILLAAFGGAGIEQEIGGIRGGRKRDGRGADGRMTTEIQRDFGREMQDERDGKLIVGGDGDGDDEAFRLLLWAVPNPELWWRWSSEPWLLFGWSPSPCPIRASPRPYLRRLGRAERRQPASRTNPLATPRRLHSVVDGPAPIVVSGLCCRRDSSCYGHFVVIFLSLLAPLFLTSASFAFVSPRAWTARISLWTTCLATMNLSMARRRSSTRA